MVARSPLATKASMSSISHAVIEHLADHYAQQRFAAEVVRVGRGWFVTTPNLWYPIEPNYHFAADSIAPARLATQSG